MDFLNVPGTQLEKLPWEHEQILRRYLSMSQHICELDELYSMMVFNLENMFEKFSLQFDDRIFAKRGEELKVRDPLLEKFTEEIQGKICRDVRALEEELSGKCRELEKNESL